MPSRTILKQFLTYLKSQVRHGWTIEARKSKGRLLKRLSFRYLNGERSVDLLGIDFDVDNQIKIFLVKISYIDEKLFAEKLQNIIID